MYMYTSQVLSTLTWKMLGAGQPKFELAAIHTPLVHPGLPSTPHVHESLHQPQSNSGLEVSAEMQRLQSGRPTEQL